MKNIFCAAIICLAVFSPARALKGGRYDHQILTATSRILQANSYKNAHADVDDGIVTLSGTVKLESARSGLEYKVRHLPHVAGVRNEILLDPPPRDDKALLGQLSRNLRDGGFDHISIRVHNGAVTLIGTVRSQRERNWILQAAWATDGVREVFPQLSVTD
jgi:osmotically-inducible protein OsmY